MKEFIKKNPDGSVKYNTKRFFTLEDAIEAEWKANSPNFDRVNSQPAEDREVVSEERRLGLQVPRRADVKESEGSVRKTPGTFR